MKKESPKDLRHIKAAKAFYRTGKLKFRKSGRRYFGLCHLAENNLISPTLLKKYIEPTEIDKLNLIIEKKSKMYWASDSEDFKEGALTDLRLTLLLFMAAINGEL